MQIKGFHLENPQDILQEANLSTVSGCCFTWVQLIKRKVVTWTNTDVLDTYKTALFINVLQRGKHIGAEVRGGEA